MQSQLPQGVIVFERGWLSSNNVLLLVDDGRAMLVDSGYCIHGAQTVALVKNALQGRPLDCILNTHLHSDHCGGNAALQAAFPDVRTLVPRGQFDAVRDWDTEALTYNATGQACPRFLATDGLSDGDEVCCGELVWQVHAAPGHDPHSVVLFEPGSRTLISADALWANGFGVVFPELEGSEAFDEVAATLELIERLQPSTVIPGHGAIFTDVGPALSRARQRLDGFHADPARHARHAARVLLKFKLLEQQRMPLTDVQRWVRATPYFRVIHARWFCDRPIDAWSHELVADLVRSDAAELSAGVLTDK